MLSLKTLLPADAAPDRSASWFDAWRYQPADSAATRQALVDRDDKVKSRRFDSQPSQPSAFGGLR